MAALSCHAGLAQAQASISDEGLDLSPGRSRPSPPDLSEAPKPGFELPPVLPETGRGRAASGVQVELSGIDFEGNIILRGEDAALVILGVDPVFLGKRLQIVVVLAFELLCGFLPMWTSPRAWTRTRTGNGWVLGLALGAAFASRSAYAMIIVGIVWGMLLLDEELSALALGRRHHDPHRPLSG